MHKVALLSGRFPITKFETPINHKLYADTYNYTYIHCNWPTKAKNLYLNKIHYILSYIDVFDYIIWIDDDAFFINFDKDIMDYKPEENAFISFCKSPTFKTLKTYLSSGQFIVKCNALSKQFFTDILHQNLVEIEKSWTKELGYFTRGDQDIIVYLLLNNEMYKEAYKLYDYKAFNSRFENIDEQDIHKPLILHFTGSPEVKYQNVLKTQAQLKLGPSLVRTSLLSNYGFEKPKENVSLRKQVKRYIKKILK